MSDAPLDTDATADVTTDVTSDTTSETTPEANAGVGTPEITQFVRSMGLGALGERMGIEIVEAGVDRVVGRMPVEGNTQPYGLLHGGASCVLAEQLGSIAAAIHGGPDRLAMGIEISASHHRAATSGVVTGVARPVHLGRTQTTHEIVITDDAGRRVCTARLTCVLRERP